MMQKYIFLIVLTTQNLKIKNMKYRFTILVHHLKNILFLYVAFLYLENAFSTAHTRTHASSFSFRKTKQNLYMFAKQQNLKPQTKRIYNTHNYYTQNFVA